MILVLLSTNKAFKFDGVKKGELVYQYFDIDYN